MFRNDLIIRCLRCGQKNRILKHQLSNKLICGRCGARLDELILRCLACGTKNIVSEERLHDRPACGRCGVPLYQGYAADISDNTFNNEVITFPGPVLVYCWAPWFDSNRAVIPILNQLAPKYAGGVRIAKLNIYENPLIAAKYNIEDTPTLLLFRNGELVNTITGVSTREELEGHIQSIMKIGNRKSETEIRNS